MTRRHMRPFWLGLSAGVTMAAVAAASFLASSETVLKSSFTTALARASQPLKMADSAAPISGSEEFWLTAMRSDGSAPVTRPVSVGDQISMTLSGHHKTFEVSAVADFSPKITEIDTSAGPAHFVLVTARDTKNPSARPVRFIMEIDRGNAPFVGSRGGRTL